MFNLILIYVYVYVGWIDIYRDFSSTGPMRYRALVMDTVSVVREGVTLRLVKRTIKYIMVRASMKFSSSPLLYFFSLLLHSYEIYRRHCVKAYACWTRAG